MEADTLDSALTAAIRAPAVDTRLDEQVWARIRADEAAALTMRRTWGRPWWLDALNVVAVAVMAVAVALAVRSMIAKPLASTFIEHSTGSVLFALFASVAGFWLASTQAPRANGRWP